MDRPCSIYPDASMLWDPPRKGSLRIRGELNRDDETEVVSFWWGECAPGRLDRVLESLP